MNKTIVILSNIIAIGIIGSFGLVENVFADHAEVTITPVPGSSTAGCQDTPEGCYDPLVATVDVGGKVIFSNTDTVAHVFAAGTIQEPTGEFDSGLVNPGASYEWTPTKVGTVEHFCTVHPWMSGTIIVQAAEMGDSMSNMSDSMDHGAMDKDGMMISDAEASGTGMLPDGTKVLIAVKEASMGERTMINVMFEDAEHVNYNIMAQQGDDTVLSDMGVHSHTGMTGHMTAPLVDDLNSTPLDIAIMFDGYGIDEITGEAGDVIYTGVVLDAGKKTNVKSTNPHEITITPVPGSSTAGCQDTPEGCYDPMVAYIDIGGKVIFSNTDTVAHVFAAGTIQEPTGEFDSGLVNPGASYEWTPTKVGTVEHFCTVHPWQSGTIIVQSSGTNITNPPSTPPPEPTNEEIIEELETKVDRKTETKNMWKERFNICKDNKSTIKSELSDLQSEHLTLETKYNEAFFTIEKLKQELYEAQKRIEELESN